MSTFVPADVIEVTAWERTVGAVAFDPSVGVYAFEYAPEWLAGIVELAPLFVPNRPGVFVFPGLGRDTWWGLPPFVADALPDRFGNALVDAWMTRHGIPPGEVTPLDRLAYTGDRAMGALQFHPPAGVDAGELSAVALADLVTAARRALSGTLDDTPEAAVSLEQLISVGTSAGGARAKAVIAYDPDTGRIRSGQLDAPEGFEHWLIKLDGVDGDATRESTFGTGRSYGIIEYAYSQMAGAAGIEMSECRLLPEGSRTHFLTRRFDRTGASGRLHLISLCALAHLDFNLAGAHSYEQYLAVVDQLGLGREAREQAFRRVVFNVASVNRDDHTKNLAFLADEHGDWRLAPAYDITFAHNPSGTWTAQHQMSVNGKRDGITRDDLEQLGDRFAVPGYRVVIGEVLAATDRWPEFAEAAGLDAARVDGIAQELATYRPR